MVLFIFISTIYASFLMFVRPSPNSLKAANFTFSQNFNSIKACLFSGLLFLGIFFFTSNYSFIAIDENLYQYFALNNAWEMANLWPIQSISHLFIHENLIHVISNIVGLGVASTYERRVGSTRFITVLALSGLASIPSIIFYSEITTVCGISGGIFGLAAAYFTDHEDLTTKQWLYAILIFTFLFILFSLQGEWKSNSNHDLQLQVGHIGHALGAIGAIIYCRMNPINLGNWK